MMETEDKLLRDFFASEKREIADNGFSRQVMRRLPHRINRWAQIWSVFITLLALLLFVTFDGLQAIISTLRDVFVLTVQNNAANLDPKSLLIAIFVLAVLGVHKAWSITSDIA